MSKEYLEALGLVKRTCELYIETTRFLKGSDIIANQIKEALNTIQNRLESIDNAEPSTALECLEKVNDYLSDVYDYKEIKEEVRKDIDTIKQALLKAQEPKHYLKWEDLEFNHTPKMIDVKMSGNKYKLVVGYNVAGKNLAILRDGKNEYYFLEYDKQFFNDLHLERVDE